MFNEYDVEREFLIDDSISKEQENETYENLMLFLNKEISEAKRRNQEKNIGTTKIVFKIDRNKIKENNKQQSNESRAYN